ncbi:MAG: hypothetical protein JHD31_04485 [Rhodoluna sp.]|jgi:hypothetical protein|nr:hypothetical protein [Rhodoluna sp.]
MKAILSWIKKLFIGERDWAHLTELERQARMSRSTKIQRRLRGATSLKKLQNDPKNSDEKYIGLRGANIGRVVGRGSALNGMLEDERRIIREDNLKPKRD